MNKIEEGAKGKMKLIYGGKYNNDAASLPHGEHMPNAVKVKEIEDISKFGLIMNVGAVAITILLLAIMHIRSEEKCFEMIGIGGGVAFMTLLPHELLHAMFFKNEVYLYHNLKAGMLFVTGPETISKIRYVIMSIFPNIIFGFIPYIIFLINPEYCILGVMGSFAIGMGLGDYYNIYNTIVQIPNSARVYMYGLNTFWYIPTEQSGREHNKVKWER